MYQYYFPVFFFSNIIYEHTPFLHPCQHWIKYVNSSVLRHYFSLFQINLSAPSEAISRSTREPRKKPFGGKKGGGLGLLLAMGLGGALSGALQLSMMMGMVVMPVIIGIVAFKAVIVSVLAFVMAGVAGFRQMMNEDKHEVVHIKAPHVDAGGWDKVHAQDGGRMQDSKSVVYSAYAPVLEHPNVHRGGKYIEWSWIVMILEF